MLNVAEKLNEKFLVREAELDDADFISIGVREAERCHAGVGIYDTLIANTAVEVAATDRYLPDNVSKYLKHSILFDSKSHIRLSSFMVMIDTEKNQRVGCACSFHYPDFGLATSIPGFKLALQSVLGYTEESANIAVDRWSFLDSAFPDVSYTDTCMIEAVYIAPSYRKMGLGEKLINACMKKAIQHSIDQGEDLKGKRFLLVCAVGNAGARRLYEKAGFLVTGEGHSEACMAAIHCSGFWAMECRYDDCF